MNIGLVLEGGGMKGLYTAGVLEFLMEKNIYFPYNIGVSAGACMAASYLSRQKGRNKKVNIDLVNDYRYISYRNFIKNRELFGMDFLFDEIPKNIVPYDFDAFLSGSEQFIVGTTDCMTGKPVYFNKDKYKDNMLTVIRASSSLPLISKTVHYDEKQLLDGGISDPIPVKKAQLDGYMKNVIIMTKPTNFKRKPSRFSSVMKMLYKKYPNIVNVLEHRHIIYNETLAHIEIEKNKGNAFVIQPSIDLSVSRIERNQVKLNQLYELGYHDMKQQFEKLKEFIDSK